MANTIALAKKFIPLLDEVFAVSALTSMLDSDASLAREGANANELQIPKMTLQGLATYSRSTGYVAGDATLAWETAAYNYERGRKFSIDRLDDEETLKVAFGKLAGEFLRTKVVPEIDAFRLATYAGLAGTKAAADLTKDTIVAALDAAAVVQDDAGVAKEGRILMVTPTIYAAMKNSGAASRFVPAGSGIDRDFESWDSMPVVKVPQDRFYTGIDLAANGAGGYSKTAGAKNLNFMVVHPAAVLQFTKNALPKIITPEDNQDADAWIFGYRVNGLADLLDNKVKGVYAHNATV